MMLVKKQPVAQLYKGPIHTLLRCLPTQPTMRSFFRAFVLLSLVALVASIPVPSTKIFSFGGFGSSKSSRGSSSKGSKKGSSKSSTVEDFLNDPLLSDPVYLGSVAEEFAKACSTLFC